MVAVATWRDQALCADMDTDIWFEGLSSHGRVDKLRAICAQCPVSAQCLEFAVANFIPWGVWAGTTPRERLNIRKSGNRLGSPTRRPLYGCGTSAAYHRHIRAGEKPCQSCVQAENARTAVYRARKRQELAEKAAAS